MIKAKCKLSHAALAGILDVGDEVEITSILSDKEVVLSQKKVKTTTGYIWENDMVSPPGSYMDWQFKSKNGHMYTGSEIDKSFGPKITLFDIFDKLD